MVQIQKETKAYPSPLDVGIPLSRLLLGPFYTLQSDKTALLCLDSCAAACWSRPVLPLETQQVCFSGQQRTERTHNMALPQHKHYRFIMTTEGTTENIGGTYKFNINWLQMFLWLEFKKVIFCKYCREQKQAGNSIHLRNPAAFSVCSWIPVLLGIKEALTPLPAASP